MAREFRFEFISRHVRQPATVILVLGSIAALAVGGHGNTPIEATLATAADIATDPAVATLATYAAAQGPFPQSYAPAPTPETEVGLPDVETMTARLEARLAKEPGDAEGWRLLGLSRAYLGDASGASKAYARALELKPGDAELMQALTAAMRESRATAE
jgi:cytochrome c-type biogenesis protein CcmH